MTDLTPEQVLRKLNRIEEEIGEKKSLRDQMIGQKSEKMERLKRTFGIKTADAAHKKVKALDHQILRRNKTIVTAFEKLEEKYEF